MSLFVHFDEFACEMLIYSYKKNRDMAQKFAAWLEDEKNGKHNKEAKYKR